MEFVSCMRRDELRFKSDTMMSLYYAVMEFHQMKLEKCSGNSRIMGLLFQFSMTRKSELSKRPVSREVNLRAAHVMIIGVLNSDVKHKKMPSLLYKFEEKMDATTIS